MKKAHRAQGFLLGMLVMAFMMGLLIPAGAASTKKTITVTTGVPIYVDGVEMKPTDANGNPVETFLYNGTTYVPLRAVSQFLGKAVKWDGTNRSVYIGKVPGEKQYLEDVCPAYQWENFYYPSEGYITMAGQRYTNSYFLGSSTGFGDGGYSGWALYNLNGEYSTLSFDVGHIDGQSMDDSSLSVYLDGQLTFTTDLTSKMLVTHYDVPLNGALQMELRTSRYGGRYGLTNLEVN